MHGPLVSFRDQSSPVLQASTRAVILRLVWEGSYQVYGRPYHAIEKSAQVLSLVIHPTRDTLSNDNQTCQDVSLPEPLNDSRVIQALREWHIT